MQGMGTCLQPPTAATETSSVCRSLLRVDGVMQALQHFSNWSLKHAWYVLGLAQISLSVWLVHSTQHVPADTLLTLVVWGGAVICCEDRLEVMAIRPTGWSLWAGLLLLLYATWRSTLVLDRDLVVYVLPLVQATGLILMAQPLRRFRSFLASLVVLTLLPLQLLVAQLLPEYDLSVLTGKVTLVMLLLLGQDAFASGRQLTLNGYGVEIGDTCNGVDLIMQVTAIAVVFCLAFPLRNTLVRILYAACAPLMGLLFNAGRIGLLAFIEGSELEHKRNLFVFFHDRGGAFVFAGLAALVMGQIYLMLVERELSGSSS